MTEYDFVLAELGMVQNTKELEPNDFQREYLQLLDGMPIEYLHNGKAMGMLADCVRKWFGSIPEGDETTTLSLNHIQFILHIRAARLAGMGARKTSDDALQKVLRPAFELLTMHPSHENIDWYKSDLTTRWTAAGEHCNWQGVWQGAWKTQGRMIAMTDSPIWSSLGSQELFNDGMGIDYPPFYINGGWLFGWKTVTKRELEGLV